MASGANVGGSAARAPPKIVSLLTAAEVRDFLTQKRELRKQHSREGHKRRAGPHSSGLREAKWLEGRVTRFIRSMPGGSASVAQVREALEELGQGDPEVVKDIGQGPEEGTSGRFGLTDVERQMMVDWRLHERVTMYAAIEGLADRLGEDEQEEVEQIIAERIPMCMPRRASFVSDTEGEQSAGGRRGGRHGRGGGKHRQRKRSDSGSKRQNGGLKAAVKEVVPPGGDQ